MHKLRNATALRTLVEHMKIHTTLCVFCTARLLCVISEIQRWRAWTVYRIDEHASYITKTTHPDQLLVQPQTTWLLPFHGEIEKCAMLWPQRESINTQKVYFYQKRTDDNIILSETAASLLPFIFWFGASLCILGFMQSVTGPKPTVQLETANLEKNGYFLDYPVVSCKKATFSHDCLRNIKNKFAEHVLFLSIHLHACGVGDVTPSDSQSCIPPRSVHSEGQVRVGVPPVLIIAFLVSFSVQKKCANLIQNKTIISLNIHCSIIKINVFILTKINSNNICL